MSDTGPQNAKYAWRDLDNQGLPKRSAPERIADCLEIYGPYDAQTAREQASRCIQCPNPTCVTGCPLCNPIPQWMQLTAEGKFLEAAAVLGSVTNMAEICTRICPSDRLCEGACILESVSEPVAIQALEQFLLDYAFAHGQVDAAASPPNGFKVAVVGSGPAGLACTDELSRKGCSVTVFDEDLVPGGLLVNGLPAFKLDRTLVQRRIDLLKQRGVEFRLGLKLGRDLGLQKLRSDFHAIFLGPDSRKARALDVPGATLPGVVQALPFILQKTTAVPLEMESLDVRGKRVAVIGGGDTAMDCLRAAIRYGAQEAVCLYRGDRANMPCGKREYDAALEEGARFEFKVLPTKVLAGPNGRTRAILLARTEPGERSNNGRRTFHAQPGTEFEFATDWMITALGFDPVPCPHNDDLAALAVDRSGALLVDENQMTNLPGVFAGGDIVRGPSLLLHAVRDARRASERMLAWLTRGAPNQRSLQVSTAP